MKVRSQSEVAQSCLTLATPWTAAYQAPKEILLANFGCHNKLPQTGWFKQHKFIPHSSRGWEVQDQGAGHFSSSLPGWKMASSLGPCMAFPRCLPVQMDPIA